MFDVEEKVERLTVLLYAEPSACLFAFSFCLFHSLNCIWNLHPFSLARLLFLLCTFFSPTLHSLPPVSVNTSCRFAHVQTPGTSRYQGSCLHTAMSLIPRIQQQQRIVNGF